MQSNQFLNPRSFGFVALAGALTAQAALSVDVLLPALPSVVRELAMSPASVQLTIAMYLAGFALGQLAWGWLSDWVGRRAIILTGTGGYAFATLMCALVDSGPELIFWRLVTGVFASASMAAVRAMMRDHFTGVELARKMAAITAVFFLSPIIAPQLGTALTLVFGWRHVFWVPGAISAASLLIAWRSLLESHAPARRRRSSLRNMSRTVSEIIRHPLSGLCLLLQAAMSFGLMAWISISSLVLTGFYAVPERYFGLYFAATAAVQLCGSILANRLLGHFGPSFLMALGGACSAIGGGLVLLVTVVAGGPFWLMLAGVWLFVTGFGLTVPASGGMALHAFGAVGGLAAAVLGSAQALVGSLGSILSAMLYDGTPAALGIGLALAAAVASVSAWTLSFRLRHRPELLHDPE